MAPIMLNIATTHTRSRIMMDYENYDPSFPDQHVVNQYFPLWANLTVFASKPAFIKAEDAFAANPALSSTLSYAQLNA